MIGHRCGTEYFILPVDGRNICVIFQHPVTSQSFIIPIKSSCHLRSSLRFFLKSYIILSFQQLQEFRFSLIGDISVVCDTRRTFHTTFGSDNNNAISTTSTINSRCGRILQDVDRFNIIRIHCSRIGIFRSKTVNHIQRTAIRRFGNTITTTNDNISLRTGLPVTCDYLYSGNTASQSLVERKHLALVQIPHIYFGYRTGQITFLHCCIPYGNDLIQLYSVFFHHHSQRFLVSDSHFFCSISDKREHQYGRLFRDRYLEISVQVCYRSRFSSFYSHISPDNGFVRFVHHLSTDRNLCKREGKGTKRQ